MVESLTNLLEASPDDGTETYYHGTLEENFRNMMSEGGLRSNNRKTCEIEPSPQVVK